jgi:hypothetical protein
MVAAHPTIRDLDVLVDKIPVSLIFEGDIVEGSKWLPFAATHMYALLGSTPGTRTQILTPVEGIRIILTTWPKKIFIQASIPGEFILCYRDFNYDLEAVGLGQWKTAIVLTADTDWTTQRFGYPVASSPPKALLYYLTSKADNYLTLGDSIYKNELKLYSDISGIDIKLPVAISDDLIIAESSSGLLPIIKGVADSDFEFTWNPNTLSTGWTYYPEVYIDLTSEVPFFYFLTITETSAGAVQRWQATVTALPEAPWLNITSPETLTQIGVYGDFLFTGGGVTSSDPPSGPSGALETRHAYKWEGELINWFFTGYIECDGYEPHVSGGYESITYDKNKIDSLAVAIYPNKTFIQSREMTVSALLKNGTVDWVGLWAGPEPLWLDLIFPPTAKYVIRDTNLGAGIVSAGTGFGNFMGTETGVTLTKTGTSLTKITCPDLPADMQEVIGTDSKTGTNMTSISFISVDTDDVGPLSLGSGPPLIRVDAAYNVDPTSTDIIASITTITIQAKARDYIYCDFDERIFIYFEMIANGGQTNLVGNSDVTFSIVLNFRGQVFKKDIYRIVSEAPMSHPETTPDDFNFGTLAVEGRWANPNPRMPKIIFAPRWMYQGQCPYIAYTTLAEEAGSDTARAKDSKMIFTLRFQLIRERRSIFEFTEPPSPPTGTERFFVPTIERVCGEYGLVAKTLFDEIEKLWPTVRFSIPGTTMDWIKNLQPDNWPLAPEPYPPWGTPITGEFTPNDTDVATTNVYRV